MYYKIIINDAGVYDVVGLSEYEEADYNQARLSTTRYVGKEMAEETARRLNRLPID